MNEASSVWFKKTFVNFFYTDLNLKLLFYL